MIGSSSGIVGTGTTAGGRGVGGVTVEMVGFVSQGGFDGGDEPWLEVGLVAGEQTHGVLTLLGQLEKTAG